MKKLNKQCIIPLIVTVIPAIALAIYLSPIMFDKKEQPPIAGVVLFLGTAVLAIISLFSLIFINKHNIDYAKAYIRTLLTDLIILLGIIPLTIIMLYTQNKDVSAVMVFIYPIVSTFMIVNRVRLTLKEQNKNQIDKPEIARILAITFINPLLPFMPLLMAIPWILLHISIDGLGIK